jgi:hypothetical protein
MFNVIVDMQLGSHDVLKEGYGGYVMLGGGVGWRSTWSWKHFSATFP